VRHVPALTTLRKVAPPRVRFTTATAGDNVRGTATRNPVGFRNVWTITRDHLSSRDSLRSMTQLNSCF
jgi:hypothetical protein